jgi:hypothetical protein
MKKNLYASLMFTNSRVDKRILKSLDHTVFFTMLKMPSDCHVIYIPEYDRLLLERIY